MLKSLELNHALAFRQASFTFGSRLNVLLGENGTGKSLILKMLYAWSQGAFAPPPQDRERSISRRQYLQELFQCDSSLLGLLHYSVQRMAADRQVATLDIISDHGPGTSDHHATLTIRPAHVDVTAASRAPHSPALPPPFFPSFDGGLFLPARELLTIYPGFQALNSIYRLSYDRTYGDAMANLGIPYLKRMPPESQELVLQLQREIHGTVQLQNERFIYLPDEADDGFEQDINLLAEGWRKLGTLMQLLRNGRLHPGMALFWDEPDANLNPQLIRLVANIIIRLCQLDIQLFLTTHSLFLVQELQIVLAREKLTEGIRFFNLRRQQCLEQGDCLAALKNIAILDEDLRQSERYLEEDI